MTAGPMFTDSSANETELVKMPSTGITMSLMREFVMLEKAPPMITPTAMSMTFPLAMKVLNSARKPEVFSAIIRFPFV